MENQQGTSFIPKSPVRGTVKPAGSRKVFVFTYVSFVFFFGTLLVTAGTFFYNISIDSQLAVQKARLAEERSSFNHADMENVRELDIRMNTAFSILDRKVSLYSLLIALEDTTLRAVQITGLEYKKDIDNSLDLALAMTTTSFNASRHQREIFSGNTVLKDSLISEIAFTDAIDTEDTQTLSESKVTFKVSKTLSKVEIPYIVSEVKITSDSVKESSADNTDDALKLKEVEKTVVEPNNIEVTGQ